jgi:flagellar motility protein MotE (MotC chaperone)
MEDVEKIVRIYKSFEEADAADVLARSRMTPQERVAIFFAIRERTCPDAAGQGLARVCRVLKLEQS